MRILYSFPHTLGKPGISTTALHQIKGAVEQGVEVDVVCTSVRADIPGVRRIVETLSLGGRRVPHRVFGVHRAYALHDRRAARVLDRLKRDVDLVHVWPAGCLKTIGAARRHGVPSFREAPSAHTQTAYEDAAREAAAVGIDLPSNHHHRHDPRQLERELHEFEAADFLLVPSEYVERTFTKRGMHAERLIRHRYGFDPAAFSEAACGHRNGGRLTVAFVGRGEPNKGLHHALKAWVESGAAEHGRFLVCGDVLPDYRERLRILLAHPSVEELGFVADVPRVLGEAHALVLPSVTEGSALVTYEAQAAGCALLVSDAAGAPCSHLQQGLVHAAGDVETLTSHLRQVDRDRDLLERLMTAALVNARSLTWSAAGQALLEAYEEGIRRHAGRATR